jgi:heterodisulfide reductase subunit B
MSVSSLRQCLYFPGCSLMATNRAYDASTRSVAAALGLELVELTDWNCCGATAYVAINERESFVLSARNLALAEAGADGHPSELVVACNGCYVALHKTEKYLAQNASMRRDVRRALQQGGMDYQGKVHVRHFLEIVMNDSAEQGVKGRVRRPLAGLKVAGYPGCQIGRPFGEIDDPEYPKMMDRLLGWLGAEAVPFPLASKCCGGMMMTTQPALGRKLTGRILRFAREAGADCLATACPLCHINLEAYQDEVSAAEGADCHIPVLYFTQLMGLAFGLGAERVALGDNLTSSEKIAAMGTVPVEESA